MIACITNFSSEPRPDYRIGLPAEGVWTEILNTDADVYDGTGSIGNLGQVVAHPVPSHGYVASAAVTLRPWVPSGSGSRPTRTRSRRFEPRESYPRRDCRREGGFAAGNHRGRAGHWTNATAPGHARVNRGGSLGYRAPAVAGFAGES